MTKVRNQKKRWWLTGGLAVGLLAGCGGSGEYKGAKIEPGRVLTGTVTWEGKPVESAAIILFEQGSGAIQKGKKSGNQRARHGAVAQGKYAVTNLQPGKYRVTFEGFPLELGFEGDQDPKVSTVEVTEETKQEHNFDLHAKKRKK
jgi:hypothetical protein